MIDRSIVETMLEMATEGGPTPVPAPMLAELARTWLRVNDAPVVDVYEMNDGRIVTDAPGHLSGQRVRLVPEADSGGDRG